MRGEVFKSLLFDVYWLDHCLGFVCVISSCSQVKYVAHDAKWFQLSEQVYNVPPPMGMLTQPFKVNNHHKGQHVKEIQQEIEQ